MAIQSHEPLSKPSSNVLLDTGSSETISKLIDETFYDLAKSTTTLPLLDRAQYFISRSITVSSNQLVHQINQTVLALLPGHDYLLQGYDTLLENLPDSDASKESRPRPAAPSVTQFLATINPDGLPLSQLSLKVGALVILLRNVPWSTSWSHHISPKLYKGTKILLTFVGEKVLQGVVVECPSSPLSTSTATPSTLMSNGGGKSQNGSSAASPRQNDYNRHMSETVFIYPLEMEIQDDMCPSRFKRLQFPVQLAFAQRKDMDAPGQALEKNDHVCIDHCI